MATTIAAVIFTFIFIAVLFGPGLLAIIIQWMLRHTHVPRVDTIIAILYATLDVTIRRAYTAERVESISSTLSRNGIEHDRLAMVFYLTIMVVSYLLLIKFGKAIISALFIIYHCCPK